MHEPTVVETPALELLEVAFDTPRAQPHHDGEARPASSKWRTLVALTMAIALAGAAIALVRDQGPMAVAAPALADDVAPSPPQGIAGFAELYVATYLTAGGSVGPELLATFYASAPDAAANPGNRFVRHVAVVGTRITGHQTWELHVAADVLAHDGAGFQADGIHHYLVGVVATEHGFAATTLPVRIAAPPPAAIAAVELGSDVEDAGLAALVDGFLAAYLTGSGDLRRFVARGASITAVDPAPFAEITVDALTAVAADASTVRVHVLATGHARAGDLRLEYHLVASHKNGVWRIDAIATAPPAVPPAATTSGP